MLIEGWVPASGKRSFQQHVFALLQSCNSIKNLIQIHSQVVLNGLSQKSNILAKLLSFYVASGHLQHAHKLFSNIDNPSTTVWNHMIRGYARSQMHWKSVECYNQMVSAEAEPDGFTFSFLLSACARGGLIREGEQVHGKVLVKGYCSNVYVNTNLINFYARVGGVVQARHVFDDMSKRSVVSWNSILAGYIRCGDFDGARRVFDEMPHRNVVSWTTMIAGCAQNGKSKQALLLFGEMRRARVELDQVSLVAALSACAELGDLKLGRWIHRYVQRTFVARNQQQPSVRLDNALIHMYASCGIIDEAYQVFTKMPQKSTVSWTSIIIAFAKQGLGKEALDLFKTMISDGVGVNEVRPDEITFIGVLCACSHAGFVDEGCQIFASMNHTWGISPRIEHYGCIVDLLSRAGFLDEARGLIETMPLKPNDALWGALLGGCRIHKNSELASPVAKELVAELNADQAAGYLVLLSNIYAFAKRWQDVITVRQKMIEMGVKKPPGRSWIQINGVVHNFVAGDMTHKHSPFIYEILCEITKQAHLEGYEPDITEVYLDVEGWKV
ncbi:pentatricopeptide repeat-containing protein At5g66520-like [Gastrolobium bilobum]|uniref:pentatricopeptide repeat-containing protein At5g66520-like n=1 Tax=Gastrolobium bilobum TaxID=150636 RepID=UPI002AB16C3A|nr:pentatricopeptide repeat-containing protein At5g66520-like [Gastrolobium bilobum]